MNKEENIRNCDCKDIVIKSIVGTVIVLFVILFCGMMIKAAYTPCALEFKESGPLEIEISGEKYRAAEFVYEYKTPRFYSGHEDFKKYKLYATHLWKHHDTAMQPSIVSCVVEKIGPAEDYWVEVFPYEDWFYIKDDDEYNEDVCKYNLCLEKNTIYRIHIFIAAPSFVKARTIGGKNYGDNSAVFNDMWYEELCRSKKLKVVLWD